MSRSRKVWLILAGIALLLVLTNPSPKDFKDYKGLDKNSSYSEVKRVYNFFLWSVYSDTRFYQEERYIGIATNFIDISKEVPPQPADSARVADSLGSSIDTTRSANYDTANDLTDTDWQVIYAKLDKLRGVKAGTTAKDDKDLLFLSLLSGKSRQYKITAIENDLKKKYRVSD